MNSKKNLCDRAVITCDNQLYCCLVKLNDETERGRKRERDGERRRESERDLERGREKGRERWRDRERISPYSSHHARGCKVASGIQKSVRAAHD